MINVNIKTLSKPDWNLPRVRSGDAAYCRLSGEPEVPEGGGGALLSLLPAGACRHQDKSSYTLRVQHSEQVIFS